MFANKGTIPLDLADRFVDLAKLANVKFYKHLERFSTGMLCLSLSGGVAAPFVIAAASNSIVASVASLLGFTLLPTPPGMVIGGVIAGVGVGGFIITKTVLFSAKAQEKKKKQIEEAKERIEEEIENLKTQSLSHQITKLNLVLDRLVEVKALSALEKHSIQYIAEKQATAGECLLALASYICGSPSPINYFIDSKIPLADRIDIADQCLRGTHKKHMKYVATDEKYVKIVVAGLLAGAVQEEWLPQDAGKAVKDIFTERIVEEAEIMDFLVKLKDADDTEQKRRIAAAYIHRHLAMLENQCLPGGGSGIFNIHARVKKNHIRGLLNLYSHKRILSQAEASALYIGLQEGIFSPGEVLRFFEKAGEVNHERAREKIVKAFAANLPQKLKRVSEICDARPLADSKILSKLLPQAAKKQLAAQSEKKSKERVAQALNSFMIHLRVLDLISKEETQAMLEQIHTGKTAPKQALAALRDVADVGKKPTPGFAQRFIRGFPRFKCK